MLRTRIMPCLLLQNNVLVKSIQFKKHKYIGDPINTVRIFNQKEVDELVLLDIEATNNNKGPNFDLISKIVNECFMPVAYGGGIKNVEDVRKLFNIGIEKVVVNSAGFDNPNIIKNLVSEFGSQSIVASIDVKKSFFGKYKVYKNSGKKLVKQELDDVVNSFINMGVGEILLNSISNDGIMKGFDFDLIKRISNNVKVPLIACGGAGTLNDIQKVVKSSNATAVALGSMVVYQNDNRSVLINFPKPEILEKLLG